MSVPDLRAPDGISRRDFARVLAGAGAAAILGSMCPGIVLPALADSGGGSSGGADAGGSIWGGVYKKKSLIWWDQGGFVDNDNYDPDQIAYREDSVNLFWEMMKADVRSQSNLEPRVSPSGDYNGTITDYIKGRLRGAINQVEDREKSLHPGTDPKGRIVAVGWTWGDFAGGWQLMSGLNYGYTEIIDRKAYEDELPKEYGWDTKVRDSESLPNGTKWRDAIYLMGRQQFTDNDYSIIVLAVTDTMVNRVGKLVVKKVLDGPNDNSAFTFHVNFSGDGAPNNTTFTLHAGESRTIDSIMEGVHYSVSEDTPEHYRVSWENQSGVIVKDATVTATCTNHKSAFLKLRKELDV